MKKSEEINQENEERIKEGTASITTFGSVFYNPVQEFNRDLSISVINVYIQQILNTKNSITKEGNPSLVENKSEVEPDITILEALAASGLRSIRYARELDGNKKIIANDISKKAVESMESNINGNNVANIVETSHSDAILLMHKHKQKGKQFDIIDLDPYGCPSIFLDSAVQAVKDNGLLLVTATDMAILAGNSPETCYAKYGSVSLKIKSCHEMALRILLQCIESHANRYGSKLSMVYHCTGCGTFVLQPLGEIRTNNKNEQVKFGLPTVSVAMPLCNHCGQRYHMGGPIWSAPIHSSEFVKQVLDSASDKLKTYKRIQGVLSVVLEEISDSPLYFTLEKLAGTLHVETPPMMAIRSAILNAGYQVSFTHTNKTGIKTNAPATVIWDIMRCWEAKHPSKKKNIEGSVAQRILLTSPAKMHSFDIRNDANPMSRRMGYVRFQENPLPYWGPGTRATAMIGEYKMAKSKQNQGKRKRDNSEENK
ncbi:probable tRNA (guanine(26)-N(2))-dimethyltransferase isoform X2 [Agrilus planipennis]|uniref:tRNA (guanine(26)-N(2))-dimethyltransferase n=1 Tax=Agrilus planipennis TaxID=224129 RepID=A0A1W4XGZ6_AGRPL|nr:probable tRNA (guanine(26)-N(2))-dimethyltransferase isoform X2 [Agrilus planipennis]